MPVYASPKKMMLSKEELSRAYTPEQVLLVLLSRLYFGNEEAGDVQAFIDANRVDTELFYKLLKAHQVRPFVYHILKSNKLTVDNALLRILQRDTFRISASNLEQHNFLNHLLDDLAKKGVLVIPYKGVALASRYYESLSMREGSDIDLFTGKNSVRTIRQYFHDTGLVPNEDVPDGFLNYLLFFYRDISFKAPYRGLQRDYTVEIQWKLIDGFVGKYPDFEWFSKHLRNGSSAERSWPGLEVTFDFICLISNHFFKEHLNRFKYLVDIGCVLATHGDKMDRAAVAAVVEKYHYRNFFNEAVQCLDEILGIKYDETTMAATSSKILQDNLLSYPVKKSEKNDYVIFALQESFLRKVILLMRRCKYYILPNYNDISAFKMDAAFLPLLFLIKPFRLLRKHRIKRAATGAGASARKRTSSAG